jgi:hypothetical protein
VFSHTLKSLGLNGMLHQLMDTALWDCCRERAHRMKALLIPFSRARYQKGIRARTHQEEGLCIVALLDVSMDRRACIIRTQTTAGVRIVPRISDEVGHV